MAQVPFSVQLSFEELKEIKGYIESLDHLTVIVFGGGVDDDPQYQETFIRVKNSLDQFGFDLNLTWEQFKEIHDQPLDADDLFASLDSTVAQPPPIIGQPPKPTPQRIHIPPPPGATHHSGTTVYLEVDEEAESLLEDEVDDLLNDFEGSGGKIHTATPPKPRDIDSVLETLTQTVETSKQKKLEDPLDELAWFVEGLEVDDSSTDLFDDIF